MTWINAHAALIDEDQKVSKIIVIPYMDDNDEKITTYCNSIGLEGRWIDTSYLGARRGKYASIGDTYDPDLDEFVSQHIFKLDGD
jgi:hypothetical protein